MPTERFGYAREPMYWNWAPSRGKPPVMCCTTIPPSRPPIWDTPPHVDTATYQWGAGERHLRTVRSRLYHDLRHYGCAEHGTRGFWHGRRGCRDLGDLGRRGAD